MPEVGKTVKVHLPGESPWAEVLEITEKGFLGRIDNKLFSEYSEFEQAQWMNDTWNTVESLPVLHDYKFNDEVNFVLGSGNWEGQWVPDA